MILPRGRGDQEGSLSDLLPVTPTCQTLQEAGEADDTIWEEQPFRVQAV